GFIQHLYRAVGADRRRPGQFDDAPVHRPGQDRPRPVRSRPGGGDVADLLPRHPAVQLGVLFRHDTGGCRPMKRFRWLIPALYILFLLLPIYWLVSMSFKTTNEILGGFTLWPRNFTLANYRVILTDPTWYGGYINSIIYVVMNTVLSVAVALPAAYAFSRYRFLGDKH